MRGAGIGIRGGAGVRVPFDWRNFLLRSDFNVDIAAPIPSPYAATPGPGTLTLVQTDGEFSISGEKLAFPAQTSAADGDQGFYGAARTRAAGLALLAKSQYSSDGIGGYTPIIWRTTAAARLVDTREHGIYVNGSDALTIMLPFGTTSFSAGATLASGTDYSYALVLRSTGAFYFIKGGAFTNWTLFWVALTQNTATLYPAFVNFDAAGTLDTFRVLDLPAPFSTDYGLVTQRLAGARSAGDTFTHEANCVIEWTQTTVPSADDTIVKFRYQDASNYWYIVVSAAGVLSLVEIVAGSGSVRANVASGISNGHRIVIVADGTTIRGYSNNVLRWTYASASNFATATVGELSAVGTGGAVSDIVSWPRTLTGAAATLLDAAVA